MQRFSLGTSAYVSPVRPNAVGGSVEALMTAAVALAPRAPVMLYWPLQLDAAGSPVCRIELGEGGLDPLLASNFDLGACVAIEAATYDRLAETGDRADGSRRERSFQEVLELLAKGPAVISTPVSGLVGVASYAKVTEAKAESPDRVAGGESLSVVVISDQDDDALTPVLEAVANQKLGLRLEIVVLLGGADAASGKRRSTEVDAWAADRRKVRVRRFLIWGEFDRAYLANTGVALATGDIVVFVDPRCLPESPTLFQALANWADAADVATVSPRIGQADQESASGLALGTGEDGQATLALFAEDALSTGLRLCAAPTPWLFATRRRTWIAGSGVRSDHALWTAALAGVDGPKGRHILLGSHRVCWTGPALTLGLPASAPTPLRPSSAKALRLAISLGRRPAPAQTPPQEAEPIPAPAATSLKASASPVEVSPSFTDGVRPGAAIRLLVFADNFGASQSIAFVEGLRQARLDRIVSVTIFAEADFKRAGDGLSATVARIFADYEPTVVACSRMADPDLWRAVRTEARRRAAPILFHIDDDLFDLPVVLGAERYRLAQQPRRLLTLHAILGECALALAASEPLARKLGALAGHGRIAVMPIGSAAAPPLFRRRRAHAPLRIVYMASASHGHDLAMIVPALNALTASEPGVQLTLFGSIGRQPVRDALDGAVAVEPGVFGDYAAFRSRLAELRFDIGLAPLAATAFNKVKTPTKWIEYAEAGIAVLASDTGPYAPLAEAGVLLGVRDDGWLEALRRLVHDGDLRDNLVGSADRLLRSRFTWERLEDGMLSVLRGLAAQRSEAA